MTTYFTHEGSVPLSWNFVKFIAYQKFNWFRYRSSRYYKKWNRENFCDYGKWNSQKCTIMTIFDLFLLFVKDG